MSTPHRQPPASAQAIPQHAESKPDTLQRGERLMRLVYLEDGAWQAGGWLQVEPSSVISAYLARQPGDWKTGWDALYARFYACQQDLNELIRRAHDAHPGAVLTEAWGRTKEEVAGDIARLNQAQAAGHPPPPSIESCDLPPPRGAVADAEEVDQVDVDAAAWAELPPNANHLIEHGVADDAHSLSDHHALVRRMARLGFEGRVYVQEFYRVCGQKPHAHYTAADRDAWAEHVGRQERQAQEAAERAPDLSTLHTPTGGRH